jgi:multisubunit Na+/H+ antiporter MnhC subunit
MHLRPYFQSIFRSMQDWPKERCTQACTLNQPHKSLLTDAAASLGGLTFSFATTTLLDRVGIRVTLGVLAGFSFVSLSPASALAQPPRKFITRNTHVVTWRVFTEPLFLCLCAVNLIYPLTTAAPTAFGPSFAESLGVQTTRASYLLAINSGVAIPWRLCAGALGDKIGHLNTLIVATFFYVLATWALWLPSAIASNLSLYIAMSVCYGLSNGGFNTVMNTAQKHMFGSEMYFPKSGVMTSICGIGYVFGVPIVGALVTRVTDDKLKGTDYVNPIVYIAVLVSIVFGCLLMIRWLDSKQNGRKWVR